MFVTPSWDVALLDFTHFIRGGFICHGTIKEPPNGIRIHRYIGAIPLHGGAAQDNWGNFGNGNSSRTKKGIFSLLNVAILVLEASALPLKV